MHRDRLVRLNTTMILLKMGLLEFHSDHKIVFAVSLKQSSFWSSADVKPVSNDLTDMMPYQYFLLSLCVFYLYSICLFLYFVNNL